MEFPILDHCDETAFNLKIVVLDGRRDDAMTLSVTAGRITCSYWSRFSLWKLIDMIVIIIRRKVWRARFIVGNHFVNVLLNTEGAVSLRSELTLFVFDSVERLHKILTPL